MTRYSVKTEVIEGADATGQVLSTCVVAESKLDAVIEAEQILDGLLPHPDRQYCHAFSVVALPKYRPVRSAMAA